MENIITPRSVWILVIVLLVVGQLYLFISINRENDTQIPVQVAEDTRANPETVVPITDYIKPSAGTVVGVDADAIQFTDNSGATVRIKINEKTVISREGNQKNPIQFRQEMEEFRIASLNSAPSENNGIDTSLAVAPTPFDEIPIAWTEINPGDLVSVFVYETVAVRVVVHAQSNSL